METIVGYMVVASGGEYSDAYHYNDRFYLDRSEAEAYIKSKQEDSIKWNLFVEACPKFPHYDSNGRPRKIQEWLEECIKICENNFPHLIEKAKAVTWFNEECEETDLQIEEIEIPIGSRLYRLLNGAE